MFMVCNAHTMNALKTVAVSCSSLDGSTVIDAAYCEPDRYRFFDTIKIGAKYSVQGAGLSYAPLSFGRGATVINLSKFNRLLAFDRTAKTITVEGGADLGSLFSFLLSEGFCLPVLPGHPQLSIGGCIACDVHGKNQAKEGLFSSHVREFVLFHPAIGFTTVSRESNRELFELTCGGFGLTGIIVSVTLALLPISNSQVAVEYVPTTSLADSAATLRTDKHKYDGLYTWNDLSQLGGYLGKGFVIRARATSDNSENHNSNHYSRISASPAKLSVPFFPLIGASIPNLAYAALLKQKHGEENISLFDFHFPIAKKSWYYRLYGRRGFLEQQVLIPDAKVDAYLAAFERLACDERPSICLASLKVFRGAQQLLRFVGDGICLSIDLPNSERSRRFLSQLDQLNCNYAAITNLAKDSRISKEIVVQQYPEYSKFRDALYRFDSKRTFISSLSERLEL